MATAKAPAVAPAAPRAAPPAPRARTSAAPPAHDRAAVLDFARAAASAPVPHRDRVRAWIGQPIEGIHVALGERARAACAAFDARAFAVGDLIAFADPSPSAATVAHEVAHVLQQRAHGGAAPAALGTLPVSHPGDRAEREVDAILSRAAGARLTPAPLGVYRLNTDGDAVDPDDLKVDGEDKIPVARSRFLKFVAAQGDFRPAKRDKALYGLRTVKNVGGKNEITVERKFEISGKESFKRDDYYQALQPEVSQQTASTDISAALADPLWSQKGVTIGNQKVVVRNVREKDTGTITAEGSYFYAIVAIDKTDDPPAFDRVQELFVDPGTPTDPIKLLNDYVNTLEKIKGLNPAIKMLASIDALIAQMKADVTSGAKRSALLAKAEQYREDKTGTTGIVPYLVGSYDYEDIEAFHDQALVPWVSPYTGLRGLIFQRWVQKVFQGKGFTIDTSKEPIFAIVSKKTGKAKWEESALLGQVRRGDGKIVVDNDHLVAKDNVIAEAKAYTKPPNDENRAQMRDYAKIIRLKVDGFMSRSPENPGDAVTFVAVDYFFSKEDIAKSWVPDLEKFLPGLYVVRSPSGFDAKPKPADTLKALKESLGKLGKTALADPQTDGKSIAERIDALLAPPADPAQVKEITDEQVATIRTDLATAIGAADAYKDFDDLYDKVLGGSVFVAPYLSMTGLAFEAWIAKNGGDVKLPGLQLPMANTLAEVTPLFTKSFKPQSAKFIDVKAGKKTFAAIDKKVVFDLTTFDPTTEPARPDADEKLQIKDVVFMATSANKVRAFFQSKAQGGDKYATATGFTANSVVQTVFDNAEFKFKDVAAATPWRAAIDAAVPGTTKLKVLPDPKDPKELVTIVQANPTFTIKIKDGDQLDQTVDPKDIKQPGVVVDSLKIRLKTQRKPNIESGSIKMSIAANPMVSGDQPVEKPIQPSVETPKPGQPPIYGKIENNIGGLKSKLDSFLKRVQTDAKLVDNGVQATITVSPGPSGLPKINLEGASVKVTITAKPGTTDLKVTADGHIGLAHESGKIKGALDIKYDKGLSITGNVHVERLVDGLEPIDASIEYVAPAADADADTPGTLKFKIATAKYTKKLGAVTFTGTATNLEYDANKEAFSGGASLSADFGLLGTATGTASFADNKLSGASIKYDSPTLQYPAKSKTPLISGKFSSTINYADEKFSGGIDGDVTLALDILKKLSPKNEALTIHAKVDLDADGNMSGSIGTVTPIAIGSHFEIAKIQLDVAKDGSVTGTFGVAIKKISKLEGSLTVKIGSNLDGGWDVEAFSASAIWEKSEKSRFWGKLTATWSRKDGLVIAGTAGARVTDNFEVEGWVQYNAKTNMLDGSLKMAKPFTLLKKKKDWNLFTFKKQIPIVSVYGIGIYIDIKFQLDFGFDFDISFTAGVSLKGLDLETMVLKSVAADLEVKASVKATLTLKQSLGIGLFVASPSLLRGGGGISVPISAIASVDAVAKPHAEYTDGKLSGSCAVAVIVSFKIVGDVLPYAEFSVLNDAFNPTWEGDSLKSFEILPPTELFRYTVNFGNPPAETSEPQMGKDPAPKDVPKDNQMASSMDAATAAPKAAGQRKNEPPEEKPKEYGDPAPGDDFDTASLLDQLKKQPLYQKIEPVLTAASKLWKKIKEGVSYAIDTVIKFFKAWVQLAQDAYALFVRLIDGIVQDGLFVTLKNFLKELMPEGLFDVLEPLLNALVKNAQTMESFFYDLLDQGLPTSVDGFIDWAFGLVKGLVAGAWDSLENIAEALYETLRRGGSAAVKFFRYLVKQGRLEVWADFPDARFKLRVGGVSFSVSGKLIYPVVKTLKETLNLLGFPPTDDDGNYTAG